MELNKIRHEVSELAFGYVMAGSLSENWLGDQVAPDNIPDRFREYDRLVDLHFALDDEVTAFVQNIRSHLRQIKTETRRDRSPSRGAISGKIDWPATFQERYNRAPGDSSLFVTEERTKAYDIAENIVLKHLLAVVYQTVDEMEEYDYDWVDDRWNTGDRNEIEDFKRIYNRNIHLDRISTPEPPFPTDRMIQASKNARSEFYRVAADLVEWRHRLLEGSQSALQTLLNSNIIEPSPDRIFELLVVLRLLEALDERMGEFGRVEPIEGGGDALAQIGDPPVFLYHNSSASHHNLRFPSMPAPDKDTLRAYTYQNNPVEKEWLRRSQAVAHWAEEIETQLWDSESDDRTRRPDAVLFRPAPPSSDRFASEILIVEVKESSRKKRVNEGIDQLLRYMAFATKTDNGSSFLFPETPSEDAFGAHVHGLLVTQDLSVDVDVSGSDTPLQIVEISNLESQLTNILSEVFGVEGLLKTVGGE